jgi:homoaconitase/3-isopropylmalate dehydratase large subunit
MTRAEKILAAHSDRSDVRPGGFVWKKVDAISNPGELALLEQFGVEKLRNPDRVSMVEDHQAPPRTVEVGGKLDHLRVRREDRRMVEGVSGPPLYRGLR